MATTNTWDQVVSKITGVVNRGAFSKTYTPSTSRQTQNGSAGYYSSITTVCNAVSLSGNASTSQVLTGRTFYTTSLTKQTGTMANRGNLNWSPSSSTSYSVPAGYYSGGTLNSSGAYNAGLSAGRSIKVTSFKKNEDGATLNFVRQATGTNQKKPYITLSYNLSGYTIVGIYLTTGTNWHISTVVKSGVVVGSGGDGGAWKITGNCYVKNTGARLPLPNENVGSIDTATVYVYYA